MSPVVTESDVAVLLSQKTADGKIIYLYPIVRDSDILLTEETGPENLQMLLEQGVKPDFNSLKAIFQNSDDFEFSFDDDNQTIKGIHKNLIAAGSTNGTSGKVNHGATIKIPSFSFDANGHLTSVSTSEIILPEGYTLPSATTTEKGGVIIGDGLSVDASGKVSVNEATESGKGIVKLNSLTDSESTTEAATPKAVSDALASAIAYVNSEVSKVSGTQDLYQKLSAVFTSGEDMTFTFDDATKNIRATHRNNIEAGTVAGTSGSVDGGGSIKIPSFEIDNHGHVLSHTYTLVTLPEEYKLPTASTTEKGGIIVGEGLEVDKTSGVMNLKDASKTEKGGVTLSSATDSASEAEAATPKAVSDALASANEHATSAATNAANEVKEQLESSGVKPKFSSLSGMILDSDDMTIEKDASNEVIKVTHKNTVDSGSVSTGGSTLNNGGTILVPTFSYDSNGHITEVSQESFVINPITGENGISVDETGKVKHTNKITAGSSVGNTDGVISFGGKFYIPVVNYDGNGHVVSVSYNTITMPANPDTNTTYTLNVTKGTTTETSGDGYDTVKTPISISFKGSDESTPTVGNIDVSYLRYKDFAGSAHGLVPAAESSESGLFLRGDGTWATPTDTKYTGSNGITVSGTTVKHSNNITAGTVNPGTAKTLAFGDSVSVPKVSYDANGHITGASLVSFKLPSNPNVSYSISQSGDTITLTGSDGSTSSVTASKYVHPTSGVTAGTYRSVTVDANGHITAGTNPTTLAGYGITDAANKSHKHTNDDITSLDGSKITGTLPIEVIPKAALERMVPVANQTARFALTTNDVQLGDTVKQLDTGIMYLVKDTANLNSESGYEPYTAGSAASVPWTGITGKPSTFTPSSHAHPYAGSSSAGGAATKAINDNAGQEISSTYIKNISFSGKTVTITRGDGTTFTGETQDTNTTYSTFKAATASAAGSTGLVPAPASGKQGLFLRGDATWATPANTTYTLTKSNGKIILTGSDGSTTEVEDSNTTYTLSSFGVTASSTELNYVKGVTSSIQTQLNGKAPSSHTHDAYANQNAFSNIVVGSTTIAADSPTDSVTFVAGNNVTITPDATNDKVTISAKDTVYTHPSYTARNSGLYKITVDATGHVSAVASVSKSDITALGIPSTNTTYNVFGAASSDAAGSTGLVPAPAKGNQGLFLRGDGTWATPTDTKYTLSSFGITASANEINYTKGVTSSIQAQINNTITGASVNGKVVTFTKADGTTFDITTQDTNTTYGAATSSVLGLVKIGSNITNSSGTISLTKANVTSALGYTPPTTNTTYSVFGAATSDAAGSTGLVPAPAKGNQGLYLRGDGTWATPTNTTYSAATSSVLGLVKIGSNITVSSGTISLTKANVTSALGYTPPTTNTTYSAFTGASSSAAGSTGLVPAPAKGNQGLFLRGDGTWSTPTDTKYTLSSFGITASANEINYTKGVTSSIQTQLNNTITGASVNGKVVTFTKGDGTTFTITTQDTNTTYGAATTSALGLVKVGSNITVSSGTISLTKANVTNALGYTPPTTNTTYSVFGAATTDAAGSNGLVPAPAKGNQGLYLRGDGTWATPTNTTYSAATSSVLGLVKIGSNITVSSGTISLTKDNVTNALGYTPPTTNTTYGAATSSALGLVKIGSNITVSSGTISLTKANVTNALGYTPPTTNTTYSVATTSSNGLMSSAMVSKMNGLDNNVISDTQPSNPSTGYTMWFKILSTE